MDAGDEDEDEGAAFDENLAASAGGAIGVIKEVVEAEADITHVQLVRRCQNGGAVAALIISAAADSKELKPMEDTDNESGDIRIPSMVITPSQWDDIKKHLEVIGAEVTELPTKVEKEDEEGGEDEEGKEPVPQPPAGPEAELPAQSFAGTMAVRTVFACPLNYCFFIFCPCGLN
jgi:hypothetical protein